MIFNYNIRQFKESDVEDILKIFNYYVKHDFAAYSEKEFDAEFFRNLLEIAISSRILVVKKAVTGYGILRNYLPYENFKSTGVLTYFIKPEFTNKGLGTILFNKLIEDAKQNKIDKIYVHLSSKNIQSLNFHIKHGFKECGRFKNIAKKFNQYFDIIWMQKSL